MPDVIHTYLLLHGIHPNQNKIYIIGKWYIWHSPRSNQVYFHNPTRGIRKDVAKKIHIDNVDEIIQRINQIITKESGE